MTIRGRWLSAVVLVLALLGAETVFATPPAHSNPVSAGSDPALADGGGAGTSSAQPVSGIVKPGRFAILARAGRAQKWLFRHSEPLPEAGPSLVATPLNCFGGEPIGLAQPVNVRTRTRFNGVHQIRWRSNADWLGCWRVDLNVGDQRVGTRVYGFNQGRPVHQTSLMSFNLRYDNPTDDPNWGARLGPILTMLDEKRPDVLGIQEGLHNQVLDLEAALPGYDWVGVGRDDGATEGEYAAIFYRTDAFALRDHGNFWLSETPDVPSVGWDAAAVRIVTWAELRPVGSSRSFFVFNTHFDHVGVTARAEAASLLARRVPEIAGSSQAFVMGDLNVLPGDAVLEPLLAEMDDARTSTLLTDDIGSFNAFLVEGGLWSIDYILYRGGSAVSFETIAQDYGVTYISDHYPVLASIIW